MPHRLSPWTQEGPPPPRVVLVGHGTVGRIHLRKWQQLGVTVAAVVHGHDQTAVIHGLPEAAATEPTWWDVCTPTASHADVLAALVALDPGARILLEKPVCTPAARPRLETALARHTGRLCINENYASSTLIAQIRALTSMFDIRTERVDIEMSKNRVPDMRRGRFVDRELGALGYEGPHLVTAAEELLGEPATDWAFHQAALRPMAGEPHAEGPAGKTPVPQGAAEAHCRSRTGATVRLNTALDRPDLQRTVTLHGHAPGHGPLRIHGSQHPAPTGPPRAHAVVEPAGGGEPLYRAEFTDDSMLAHLHRCVRHFTADAPNPYPASRALRCLDFLTTWLHTADRTPPPAPPAKEHS